ncbi:MAG: metallophosphoesterase [Anaerolineaceae bacterium]|nr:metallophosphoesterase [Anaerolineaceae bacterium]
MDKKTVDYRQILRFEGRKILRVSWLFVTVLLLCLQCFYPAGSVQAATEITFTGAELLGMPTDTSITINIIPDSAIEYYYQYGTNSGSYSHETAHYTASGGEVDEIVISGLEPDTQYFYRMQYNYNGSGWVVRSEHTFHTQRDEGESFVFTVLSDSHAMYNTQYQNAVIEIIADQPDFHLDLGDTFMTDSAGSQGTVDNEYLAQRGLPYIGGIGQSSPIFLASGNHENEEGWNLDDAFSIALASIQARKAFYPTPNGEGGFYSGNTDLLVDIDESTYGDEYREDYYAWEWGDALFIVFDPFQYTMANPYGATAGESNDDPASGDRWNWTLGKDQFDWLENILSMSNAKYKFVFAHHMLGGTQNYVRGGAVPAHMFEWGGYNADGTTWGFDTERVGWGDTTIHQMFIDYGVSAFFHGHDHQYAYEVRDGIVYLSLPRPSTGLDFSYYSISDPYTEVVMSSPGYIRVSVDSTEATVQYISSNSTNHTISHEFTIEPNEVETGILGDVNGDKAVNSIDALIVLSGGVGIDISQYCPLLCGDVNGDKVIDSTDALMILSYGVGVGVPYPVGQTGCSTNIPFCEGCGSE